MTRLILILLAIPTLASAQMPPGFDPEKMLQGFNPEAMQKMAAEAEKMQACMAKIDKSKMEALQKEGEKVSQEIDRLCDASKKDEARARAIEMGKSMQANPTLKQLRECTKGMSDMAKYMPSIEIPEYDENDASSRDSICD